MKRVWRAMATLGCLVGVALGSAAGLHAQQEEPAAALKAQWLAAGRPLWALARYPAADAGAANALAASVGVEVAPDAMFDWTRIAFDSGRDGNWEVYTARGDGAQPQRVTNHPATDVLPQLNRGATTVFFVSDRDGDQLDIFSANANGSNVQRLTRSAGDDTSPALSPNGATLVYSCYRNDNWELCRVQANGTGETRLTYSPDFNDFMPAWSPDGQRIVWVREQNSAASLWTMGADGSNALPLTGNYRYLENPRWSPDGRLILFDADLDNDYWSELAIYDLNLGYVNWSYNPPQPLVDAWAGDWSPDGQYVAFNLVQYTVVGNQLRIGALVMARMTTSNNTPMLFPGSGLDLLNDWQVADVHPPETQVTALPAYARASGFQVTWAGNDVGPAGIASFDVQRRVGNGAWTNWLQGVTATSATYTGAPGELVSFRVRGRDHAGNVEEWPAAANGDASTTLFSWVLSGRVLDNRGLPLPRADVVISPAPSAAARTDLRGSFRTLLLSHGAHTVSASRAGYGPAPASAFQFIADRALDIALPPLDDRVQNGGFEAAGQPLAGWQTGGAVRVGQPGQWGAHAAQLGKLCPAPCFADPVPIWSGGILDQADVAVDSQGNFHIVYAGWDGATNQPAAMHTARLRDGTMAPATLIGRAGDYHYGVAPKLAVGVDDVLHAVWAGKRGLYYSRSLPGDGWAAAQVIGPGDQPDIAVDSQGYVHIIYQCFGAQCGSSSRIYYRQRTADGQWQPPVGLDAGDGYMLPGIAVGPDDAVHLIWQESSGGVFARTRQADGSWSAKQTVYTGWGYTYEPQVILADPFGGVHALWNWPYQVYYAYRQPDGTWSTAQALPQMQRSFRAAVDPRGRLHVLGMLQYAAEEGLYYTIREPSGAWSTPVRVADGQWDIAFGADGIPQMLGYDMSGSGVTFYRTARRLAEPSISTLAQSLVVANEMHRPTLGFWYRIDGASADSRSRLAVTVRAGVSVTQAFTATLAPDWRQAAVDLTPWRGQTVTVDLEFQQAAGDFYEKLLLDNVSVGSWLTPVPRGVLPKSVPSGAATRLTIQGDNFLSGAAVRINATPLTGVTWLDEQTLEADLPAGYRPGLYNVWVVNPGGQAAVLPSGLRVGRSLWLPLVTVGSRP